MTEVGPRPTKLLRRFVAIAGLAILILCYFLFHTYSQTLTLAKNQFHEQQLLLARQTAAGIERNIELLVREAQALACTPATRAHDLASYRPLAETTFSYVQRHYVNDIGLLDAHGILELGLRAEHLNGTDFSFRSYFKEARAQEDHGPVYQQVTFKGVNKGKIGVVVAVPVGARDGSFNGVVLFTIIVSDLISGLAHPEIAHDRIWVVDSDGKALFHPRYAVGTALADLPDLDPSYRRFLADATSGRPGGGEYLSPAGVRSIASYHPIMIGNESWVVIVADDESTIKSLLNHFMVDYGSLTGMVVVIVLIGSLAVLAVLTGWNRELETTVRTRTQELEAATQRQMLLASQLATAEENERRRLACQLHDSIGQTLAVAKIRLGALRQAVSTVDLRAQVDQVRELIKETIQTSTSMTFELCPNVLHELGLDAALEWLVEETARRHDIAVALDSDGLCDPGSTELRSLLYHTSRELLMNVIKHAGARQANVTVRTSGGSLRITVEDDGCGFISEKPGRLWSIEGGFGIYSVRERLRMVGGQLEIDSEIGRGTRATITVPLPLPVVSQEKRPA
jgi:signal transduction histidine kinase